MVNILLFNLMISNGDLSIGQMEELDEVMEDIENEELTKYLLVEALSTEV